MTSKQRLLQSITNQINSLQRQISALQAYYEESAKMPDSVFDSLASTIEPNNSVGANINTLKKSEEATLPLASYGNNRKLIARILADNGRAMLKSEIIKEVERLDPSVKFVESVVRNSLSALQSRKVVKQFKPVGVKMRGGYWALVSWWDGDKLKEAHQPEPYDATFRYVSMYK